MIEVIAKLDKSSRARLSWIQSFAASFGIVPRPIYGHICLASIEREAFAAVRALLADQAAFPVAFAAVEVLPWKKTIAAVAVREGMLEAIHERLVPGTDWVPCTALVQDNVMDLAWVCSAMRQMFEPFTAQVDRIEFMDNGTVIDGIDLKGETV